jgi:hypothetical protein
MLTGMLLANVLPGVFTWLDYSTPAYIQRLLYLVLGGLLIHLLFVKALNWLSFRKKSVAGRKKISAFPERKCAAIV